jgi:Holliday junction resolvasome RuvABC endonuclease subunit
MTQHLPFAEAPRAPARSLRVVGIDPGPEVSAVVLVTVPERGQSVLEQGAAEYPSDPSRIVRVICEDWQPDLVAIEIPAHFYPRGNQAQIAGQANKLFKMVDVAAQIFGQLTALEKPVERLPAREVRVFLCPPKASPHNDQDVALAMSLLLENVPRCTEDVRDATGVAIAAAWKRFGREPQRKTKGAKR